MNKVELIKAEIERRYKDNKADGYTLVCEELDDLLSFIDSLEEEPASDDLEKAAEEYVEKIRDLGNSTACPQFNCHDAERLFIHGGKWQKQQMMKNCAVGYVIARNKNCLHPLRIYDNIPKRYACDDGREFWMGNDIRLPDTLFPEITWEDEPKEVKLIIIMED